MDSLRIGLIGTGYMGEAHTIAFRAAPAILRTKLGAALQAVADIDAAAAERFAVRFGFARWTADWRDVVADPDIDLVAIATPNALHKQIALAALQAGKHVYCEKPLALNLAEAAEMRDAAAASPARTLVGYNYLRNPAIIHAKRLIADGAIGDPVQFCGTFAEDYMADPAYPFSWRCSRAQAGAGVLGDMGSHVISMAHHLVGDIAEVCADLTTAIAERPLPTGGTARVENDDLAHALVRFSNGAVGTIDSSRLAWGRKNHLAFEVYGTRGAILFDQERLNELRLYRPDAEPASNGYRTVLMGALHPPYGAFTPAPGHQLGYNDLKAIEVGHLLDGIAGGEALYPDFAAAYRVEEVIDAMLRSAAERAWVTLDAGRH